MEDSDPRQQGDRSGSSSKGSNTGASAASAAKSVRASTADRSGHQQDRSFNINNKDFLKDNHDTFNNSQNIPVVGCKINTVSPSVAEGKTESSKKEAANIPFVGCTYTVSPSVAEGKTESSKKGAARRTNYDTSMGKNKRS